MLNEYNKEILQQSREAIKSRDEAFVKMVAVFLLILILFNGSALAIIAYCYFQTHTVASCDEFTKNIAWIIKAADSALSWFVCSATAFYALDKTKLVGQFLEKIQDKINDKF